MKKVTVFKGVINGHEYDNVADYNAAFKELMDRGETDIQASSSTSVKTIEDEASTGFVTTCTTDQCPGTCIECTEDEDLSFYPYMEDDDPHYLDILATSDKVTNYEAYTEAQNVLEKNYRYICDALNDPDVCNCERKEYLEDINDIIKDVENDLRTTKNTLEGLAVKYDAAKARYEEAIKKAEEAYEIEKKQIEESEVVLVAAKRVGEMFEAFYYDVANETILAIKNHEEPCNKACKNEDNIVTECKEKSPSTVRDFNDLLDKIFSKPGFFAR